MSRTRSRRSSACSKAALGCGTDVLTSANLYALSGQSQRTPLASCPQYTGIVVFLLVLYGFWVALLWTFRPNFVLKAGANRADPNSVDLTSGFLYSALFAALVLIVVALVVRCQRCVA